MTAAYVKGQRRVVLHKDYVRVVDGALERQTQWEDHPYPDLDLTPLYAEFLRRRGYVEDVSGTPSETPKPAPKPHYAEARAGAGGSVCPMKRRVGGETATSRASGYRTGRCGRTARHTSAFTTTRCGRSGN